MSKSAKKPVNTPKNKSVTPLATPPVPPVRSSLKTWLDSNKVFFETIAAVLLSITAVFVAWAQLQTMNAQTRIMEQTILPQLIVTDRQVSSSEESDYRDLDTITVENDGGIVKNFRSRSVVTLEVEAVRSTDLIKRRFFLHGYFGATTIHAATGKGLLVHIQGYKNNQKYSELHKGLLNLSKDFGIYVTPKISRYLKVNYEDVLGREHLEYYRVSPVFGGTLIPAEEGDALFTASDKSFGTTEFLDFDALSVEQLQTKVLEEFGLQGN